MSTVRMCDFQTPDGICGAIFSEKERGWWTGQMTFVTDEGGTVTERVDFCPDHSPSPDKTKRQYPRYRQNAPALPQPDTGWTEHSTDWSVPESPGS